MTIGRCESLVSPTMECGREMEAQCGDCGWELCRAHRIRCQYCDAPFCEHCIDDHEGDCCKRKAAAA